MHAVQNEHRPHAPTERQARWRPPSGRGRLARIGQPLVVLCAVIALLLAAAPAQAGPRAGTATASPTDASTSNAATVAPTESSHIILGEMSIDGPALWTSNPSGSAPSLDGVLAWSGTDAAHSLNLMTSGDGLHYGGKVTFGETSGSRPAVTAQTSSGTIIMAWIGTDPGHTLNLLCHGGACGTERKLILNGQTSIASPALAAFGSGFLLSWTGTDPNHSLNILPFSLTSGGSGFALGTQVILSQFSATTSPSLAPNPQNGQLFLSWSATTPRDQITFATSSDAVHWSGAQGLPQTSASAPSGLAVAASGMPPSWIAWTGTNAGRSLNVQETSSFPQWPISGNMSTLFEAAYGPPALGYGGDVGRVILAWTGTDAAHTMNLATVTTRSLSQRVDDYIAHLSTAQQIGQTLMMAVYTSGYNANINQALTQWDVGNAIIFNNYKGGPLQPTTIGGMQQLTAALQGHADLPMLLAVDEEGGTVDRLAPYYGSTPSAQQLGASGDPQNAYNQAQTDAARILTLGMNVDFAPVVDVYQGGGEGASRMFGSSVGTVTSYAGAFLNGLQQHGVAGTLKHWPGLGAASGNPDVTLPTISSNQSTLNSVDFAPFRNLLGDGPDMIMVTTVLVPAYDSSNPAMLSPELVTTVLVPAYDSSNPAMLSPELVTTVLRGQLGYQGIIVTDALDAQGLINYMSQQGYSNVAQGLGEAAVRAFLAGDDLIEAPIEQDRLAAVVTAMTNAVQSGRISPSRLQASVHRILLLKAEMGLLVVP